MPLVKNMRQRDTAVFRGAEFAECSRKGPHATHIMMELYTRACRPEDIQYWAEFLNRNFGYGRGESYEVDFAPLFDSGALSRSRLVWSGDKIISSATFYPLTAITPRRTLKLAVVGAVATEKAFRGQGVSRQILQEIEIAAKAARIEGLILWSDQTEFYEKLGFLSVGKQFVCSLSNLPKPNFTPVGVPAYGWNFQQVRSLYNRHKMRVLRTDAHWKAIERISSCTRVQWLDNSGRTTAYLGFDRGKDLHGIIHEWGGEKNALHSLLWTVLQSRKNLMWLSNPFLDDPILELLPQAKGSETPLALFKPISTSLAAQDFEQAWFWGLDSL